MLLRTSFERFLILFDYCDCYRWVFSSLYVICFVLIGIDQINIFVKLFKWVNLLFFLVSIMLCVQLCCKIWQAPLGFSIFLEIFLLYQFIIRNVNIWMVLHVTPIVSWIHFEFVGILLIISFTRVNHFNVFFVLLLIQRKSVFLIDNFVMFLFVKKLSVPCHSTQPVRLYNQQNFKLLPNRKLSEKIPKFSKLYVI